MHEAILCERICCHINWPVVSCQGYHMHRRDFRRSIFVRFFITVIKLAHSIVVEMLCVCVYAYALSTAAVRWRFIFSQHLFRVSLFSFPFFVFRCLFAMCL